MYSDTNRALLYFWHAVVTRHHFNQVNVLLMCFYLVLPGFCTPLYVTVELRSVRRQRNHYADVSSPDSDLSGTRI